MINEYIVQYYFGKIKPKYGKWSTKRKITNESFCLYVSAHSEEEAKLLAKMQIRYGQKKIGEITIIGVKQIIEA
jgi:hypothetical protein